MDAYDQFWQWADKPLENRATIPWTIHQPVMGLSPEDRRDRAKVNDAVAGFEPENEKGPPTPER